LASEETLFATRFAVLLQFVAGGLNTCMHVPVPNIPEISWAGPCLRGRITEMEGRYAGLFVASHNNIQLHYIICFCWFSSKGGDTDTMWDRTISLTFPSNPGRLVEVLLRALVGYRHDGKKAFDAKYQEAYHNSVLIQEIFRQG
jgi:hypothetical protein